MAMTTSIPLLLLFAGIFLILLLTRTLAHLLHSRLGTRTDYCKRRTDTRNQFRFHLAYPQPVIFDFTPRGEQLSTFEVTVPAYSRWSSPATFHLRPESCITVRTHTGNNFVTFANIIYGSGTTTGPPSLTFRQEILEYLVWGNHGQTTSASVLVTADVQLYRTLCSVAQDAGLYFELCSTPTWIRELYGIVGWVPYYGALAQRGMVRVALYIQERVVFYKNDCWPDQGMVWIDWYWWTTPRWVWEFQAVTMVVISRATLAVLYWVGRLVLGMRETYEEYEVPEGWEGEKMFGDVIRSEKVVGQETFSEKPTAGKGVARQE